MRSLIFTLACWALERAYRLAQRFEPAPRPKPRRIPTCGHPDRKHFGKGMCEPCRKHERYLENREHRIAVSSGWNRANRDRINEQRRLRRAAQRAAA